MRHFVRVGARRVHYSRLGAGPAVVLIHESPVAQASLAVPQGVFAERFTAIAMDTPGYGLSDPLPMEAPEIADYADALAETLGALGLGRVAVYGRHTGASIALEFARRHPGRCAMAVVDGLPVYAGALLETRLRDYLVPLEPRWDGSHLVWLWFRYRDQHSFWPWHAHDGAHRADQDVPEPEVLHQGVVAFLEAGDGYRTAYAAAFRHGGEALGALAATGVPVCCAAREGDSLFRTLGLFPDGTWIAALERDEAAAARRVLALLERHPGEVAGPAPESLVLAGRSTPAFVEGLLVRRVHAEREGVPLLLVHEPGSGSAAWEGVLAGLARPGLVVDLPGHGESPAGAADVGVWAEGLERVLRRLGLGRVDVFAQGAGAAAAVELARRAPGLVGQLTLGSPPVLAPGEREGFAAGYAPEASPSWEGAHLLRVWHHLRDQALWFPWHQRTRGAALRGALAIDPRLLNARALLALKHAGLYRANWAAALSYPLRERLAEMAGVRVVSVPGDVFAPLAVGAEPLSDLAAALSAR